MKTVYVVEDQQILREFVTRLIEDKPMLNLVGASGDGQDACKECLKLKPDIIVLDVFLPGLNGVDILRRLKRDIPGVNVLGFSAFPNSSIVKQMVEAGADGLVRKSESLAILDQALDQVSAGQTYFSPDVVEMLRQMMLHPERATSADDLSSREREIVQLVAEGKSNKEIATLLNISIKTAETHRTNIMRKLNLHDAVSLTRYAITQGIIEGKSEA